MTQITKEENSLKINIEQIIKKMNSFTSKYII